MPTNANRGAYIVKNAIWFSRHAMTAEQSAEVASLGYVIVSSAAGDIAGRSINTDEELAQVLADLRAAVNAAGACAIFGVFATPVQAELTLREGRASYQQALQQDTADIPCYAAWNIQRSVEGGKPTFAHKRFLFVGSF